MSEPTEEQLLREAIREIAHNYKCKYELAVKPFIDRLIELEKLNPKPITIIVNPDGSIASIEVSL